MRKYVLLIGTLACVTVGVGLGLYYSPRAKPHETTGKESTQQYPDPATIGAVGWVLRLF